ncbi:MAG TPA: hypothetical protein VGB82_19190 [Alphaproteobacteria bacterium]
MKTFVVALATGVGLAAALPLATALTTAIADDWIATAPPIPLVPKVEKANKPRHAAHKNGAGDNTVAAAQPGPIQAQVLGSIETAPALQPISSQPAR